MALQRPQGAVEPQIVLVKRAEAPRQRRFERRHDNVEEDAVAFEAEPARVGVVAHEQIRRHLRQRLHPIAGDGDAVLDGAFEHPLHLTDLIALFRRGARGCRLGRRRHRRRRDCSRNDQGKPFHKFPLLPLRCAIENIHLVHLLPVLQDFDAHLALNGADVAVDFHQIRLTLQVDVAHHLRDA